MTTNRLLPCADLLITDYSSVTFEYALMGRPMVLWCPDLEEYIRERDFYLDIKRDMPCEPTTEDLEGAVKKALSGEAEMRYEEFCEKYMSSCDGNATKRIADFITQREAIKKV